LRSSKLAWRQRERWIVHAAKRQIPRVATLLCAKRAVDLFSRVLTERDTAFWRQQPHYSEADSLGMTACYFRLDIWYESLRLNGRGACATALANVREELGQVLRIGERGKTSARRADQGLASFCMKLRQYLPQSWG
jgi:hypothetical protein